LHRRFSDDLAGFLLLSLFLANGMIFFWKLQRNVVFNSTFLSPIWLSPRSSPLSKSHVSCLGQRSFSLGHNIVYCHLNRTFFRRRFINRTHCSRIVLSLWILDFFLTIFRLFFSFVLADETSSFPFVSPSLRVTNFPFSYVRRMGGTSLGLTSSVLLIVLTNPMMLFR